MAVIPGTRLGPYEIVSPIGAGGMGEVYRATDTRLGRDVALKTLPSAFAKDDEQRARFEREARSASSLNHPHICVIHDMGPHDGIDYLVMELLEGETGADCLARSPMPVADVMRLGAQIADALDRAHKQGLVHSTGQLPQHHRVTRRPHALLRCPAGGSEHLESGAAEDGEEVDGRTSSFRRRQKR
ncbi:MAG: serine/threonine protein kinase [Acidobacteria bacterium]|nr:serine/threonine protein kinase [Acidobacteriota bacterium]